jgi:hypothetical protein
LVICTDFPFSALIPLYSCRMIRWDQYLAPFPTNNTQKWSTVNCVFYVLYNTCTYAHQNVFSLNNTDAIRWKQEMAHLFIFYYVTYVHATRLWLAICLCVNPKLCNVNDKRTLTEPILSVYRIIWNIITVKIKVKVKVNVSLYSLCRPLGLWEVRLTDGSKVVSPTHRPLFTPRKILVLICYRMSWPQGHGAARTIR